MKLDRFKNKSDTAKLRLVEKEWGDDRDPQLRKIGERKTKKSKFRWKFDSQEDHDDNR